jgi:hypothetical protein
MTPDIHQLLNLSEAERLLLAQDLWDSIITWMERQPVDPVQRPWIAARTAYADRLDAEWFGYDDVVTSRQRDA